MCLSIGTGGAPSLEASGGHLAFGRHWQLFGPVLHGRERLLHGFLSHLGMIAGFVPGYSSLCPSARPTTGTVPAFSSR